MECENSYLIIAGASKCGTTTLHHWLTNHKDIFIPSMKEIHFFSYEQLRGKTSGYGDSSIVKTLCTSFSDFHKLFSTAKKGQVLVDNSPSYFYYSRESSKLIKDSLPDSKILIILRNPVNKVFSQYMHLVRDGRETLDFETALSIEKEREEKGYSDMWLYKKSGYYYSHVKDFISEFGNEKVKVCFFEDMVDNPDKFVSEILNFVDLSADINFDSKQTFNASGKPRSKFISRYLLGGPLYVLAKAIIPSKFGGKIRRTLQSLNTGKKETLRDATKQSLIKDFSDDITKLEELLSLNKGTIVKKFGWGDSKV